jgi:hypothetical protein
LSILAMANGFKLIQGSDMSLPLMAEKTLIHGSGNP